MQEPEKSLLYLAVMGGLIGLGKLFSGDDVLTPRLILGRALMGSATSLIAGVSLLHMADLPLPALIGLGAALGILGSQTLEIIFRKFAEKKLGGEE